MTGDLRRCAIVGLACASVGILPAPSLSQCADGFLQTLTISRQVQGFDGCGKAFPVRTESRVLHFGVSSTATDSIDEELGEFMRPPLPIPDIFIALWGGGLQDVDIRPRGPLLTHVLSFSFDSLGAPVVISWDSGALQSSVSSARLQDPFGGVFIDVDMLAVDQVELSNDGFSSFNLVFTTRDDDAPDPDPPIPTQLTITQEPAEVHSNEDFTLVVEARDDNDQLALYCGFVTPELVDGPGSARFFGALATNGVATLNHDSLVKSLMKRGTEDRKSVVFL